MRFARIGDWLVRLTLLIVGASIGSGLLMLVQSNAAGALNAALLWGAGIGVGAFLLALLLYTVVRPRPLLRDTKTPPETKGAAGQAIKTGLIRLGLIDAEADAVLQDVKREGLGLAQMVLRFWSSAAALGTAVAITGSVIAMITAVAAMRQVERIDAQNALIEQQIEEAQASRAASVFAAQLPSLLAAIDAERGDRIGLWLPSTALLARIQAVVDLAEPYKAYPHIDETLALLNAEADGSAEATMLFSPQRGQLLRLLLASGIDFENLLIPLNFEATDLTGITLRPVRIVEIMTPSVSLGPLNLSRSNFSETTTRAMTVNGANLQGAVFARLDQLIGLEQDLNLSSGNFIRTRVKNDPALVPTRLNGVVVLSSQHAVELQKLGWLGTENLRQVPEPPSWHDNQGILSDTLRDAEISRLNPIIFQSIEDISMTDDGYAIRFGPESLLDIVESGTGLRSGVLGWAWSSPRSCDQPELHWIKPLLASREDKSLHPKVAWAGSYAFSRLERRLPALAVCAKAHQEGEDILRLDELLDLN